MHSPSMHDKPKEKMKKGRGIGFVYTFYCNVCEKIIFFKAQYQRISDKGQNCPGKGIKMLGLFTLTVVDFH